MFFFPAQEFTAQQLALLENDTTQIEQRDREIMKIAQSIKELGDIFKELSTLIIDQVRRRVWVLAL